MNERLRSGLDDGLAVSAGAVFDVCFLKIGNPNKLYGFAAHKSCGSLFFWFVVLYLEDNFRTIRLIWKTYI